MRDRKVDPRALSPGDVGIWATCAMKKEAKSVGDLRDLFDEVSRSPFRGLAMGFGSEATWSNRITVRKEAVSDRPSRAPSCGMQSDH